MYNQIKKFTNDSFGTIRTIMIGNEPFFVGKDVAVALGYVNPQAAIRTHVSNDDKTVNDLFTVNGTRGILINESGMYSLIFGSNLPSAKQFKRWVTSEILPQIRQTGGYIPINSQDDEKTILAKALQISERTLHQKDRIIEAKNKALSIAQPKADLYDKLMNADGYFSFNVAAKELGTGRNKLMKLLRDRGILFRDGLSNIAYQRYCDNGYFVVKHSIGRNGYACGVTKVTTKGLNWMYHLLNRDNTLEGIQ